MTTALSTPVANADVTERLGRVALATQGFLYVAVGALALSLAFGDHSGDPSQKGAIESVARQPFGEAMLVVLLIGLMAHAAWRVLLAVRGEQGSDDDGQSIAKRVANLGRAAIYVGFSYLAIQLLLSSSGGEGDAQKESTARVLDWPAGQWLVVGVGVAVVAAGLWNMSKIITAVFLDDLDLGSLDERKRHIVEIFGRVGYLARGFAFGLVGWFLIEAGLQHDPSESRGLDESLSELAAQSRGPWMLGGLALGLALFGAYRMLDARFRKPSEIVNS